MVSVTSEAPMKVSATAANHSMPSMPPHPAHPLGHYHQLLYMSTQATVADILQQVSGIHAHARIQKHSCALNKLIYY